MASKQPQEECALRKIASDIVEWTSRRYSPLRTDLVCSTCKLLPLQPITCFCGHTRCSNCIYNEPICSCGVRVPVRDLKKNVIVHDLVMKLLGAIPSAKENSSTRSLTEGAVQFCKHSKCYVKRLGQASRRIVCPKGRYKHVRLLVRYGLYMNAAANLVLIAAAREPLVSLKAMNKLLRIVEVLGLRLEQGLLVQKLQRAAQTVLSNSYHTVSVEDLECPVCYEVMQNPVTTPCGHTFCRRCILNSLKYNKKCPFCNEPTDQLDIFLRRDTIWIEKMIAAKLNRPTVIAEEIRPSSPIAPEFKTYRERRREVSYLIPMFQCAVAFPTIPCPFVILGPHLHSMIRRIMSCGGNQIGMVTTYNDGSIATFGTVVEVQDCLELEDGSTILTTVGIGRFETLKRTLVSGGYIARVATVNDIPPSRSEYLHLNLEHLAKSITYKVVTWLKSLNASITREIINAFGPMPHYSLEEGWWMNPRGPRWLWWIIAILPIKTGLQLLLLSTTSLHKRMLSVSRSLDMVQHSGLQPGAYYENVDSS